MKKVVTLLVALLLCLGLVGCQKKEDNTVKVGVSIYKFDDAFMTLYREEIKAYFDTLSTDTVKYVVDVQDGKNDQETQNNQIDNFITQQYDVLIINLVQSSSAKTVLDKVAAAGIPCIFINREPSEENMKYDNGYAGKFCYVGADARQSGKFQGELIADLANKGDLNGDGVLKYIMVEGDPENVDAQYRTEFSISQYKEKAGLAVECLDDQVGNWDRNNGYTITANALTKFASEIEVVFCNNDDMAMGAKQAIKEAGRKIGEDIYLVGVDALAEAVQSVVDGEMTGTVLNDHIGQSHQAVDCAIKAVKGEKLNPYYWVDYVKVTPETAKDYLN